MSINVAWLTINRRCNLKCKWCYAQEYIHDGSTMNYQLATELISLISTLGIRKVYLIGGEPTIHPDFFRILDLTNQQELETVVVTNGVLLANDTFCNRVQRVNHRRLSFGISLKGINQEDYILNCASDAFLDVVRAIKNCDLLGFQYGLSYVLTTENITKIGKFVEQFHDTFPQNRITFALCNDVIMHDGKIQKNNTHPLYIQKTFEQQYQVIDSTLDGRFTLHESFPLCCCNRDIIATMVSKNQIYTSCHVHNREGVVFDECGSILLCNHLAGFPVGKYGKDFWDANSFRSFWDSDYFVSIYKKLTSMPSEKCASCDDDVNCGGGCCVQWFSNTFDSFMTE